MKTNKIKMNKIKKWKNKTKITKNKIKERNHISVRGGRYVHM